MGNYTRDDLDAKALRRLLTEKQLAALSDLIEQASATLFDAVAGAGCWQAEFTDEQRRTLCQRIIVRMVGELFKPEEPSKSRSSILH
jgi:cytochrome P450